MSETFYEYIINDNDTLESVATLFYEINETTCGSEITNIVKALRQLNSAVVDDSTQKDHPLQTGAQMQIPARILCYDLIEKAGPGKGTLHAKIYKSKGPRNGTGSFVLTITNVEELSLEGKTLQIKQGGVEIMTAEVPADGIIEINGHSENDHCEIYLDGHYVEVIEGGIETDVDNSGDLPEFDVGADDEGADGCGCGDYTPPDDAQTQDCEEYTIVSGDTLSQIASRYGLSWRELYDYDAGTGTPNSQRLRSGDPNLIYPDEVIVVPN